MLLPPGTFRSADSSRTERGLDRSAAAGPAVVGGRIARLAAGKRADACLSGSALRHHRVAPAGDGTVAAGRRDVARHAQPALRALAAEQRPFLALVVVSE